MDRRPLFAFGKLYPDAIPSFCSSGKKLLLLFVQGLLPSFTGIPHGKTGDSPQDKLPATGVPHAIVIARPTRVGMLIKKEAVGVLVVVHICVVPGDRFSWNHVLEPIQCLTLAKTTTGPFFMGRSGEELSMIASVQAVNVVHVVLVLNPRKTGKDCGIKWR